MNRPPAEGVQRHKSQQCSAESERWAFHDYVYLIRLKRQCISLVQLSLAPNSAYRKSTLVKEQGARWLLSGGCNKERICLGVVGYLSGFRVTTTEGG